MPQLSATHPLQRRHKAYSNSVLGLLLAAFACLLVGGAYITWNALTDLLLS